jgi:hypothetical protein
VVSPPDVEYAYCSGLHCNPSNPALFNSNAQWSAMDSELGGKVRVMP